MQTLQHLGMWRYQAAVAKAERESHTTVQTIDNHIYYYADVDSDYCLRLIRAVREQDAELRAEHLSRGMEGMPLTPIWLHIHSYGGSLFTAFSIADQLKMIKSPIYSVIEGICASAATLLALSCSKRYILPGSFMLIHQLSGSMWGTHEQFKDELNLQNKLMERLVEFYVKHSGVTDEQIRGMLTRDYWLDAEECLKLKLVDEILA
jgi:ATP-dependent Clp endopeptidase proteolytic subunit ClpP